jgi:hypothetical protein
VRIWSTNRYHGPGEAYTLSVSHLPETRHRSVCAPLHDPATSLEPGRPGNGCSQETDCKLPNHSHVGIAPLLAHSEGSGRAVRCRELGGWLEPLNGLAHDMPLTPQPQFHASRSSGQNLSRGGMPFDIRVKGYEQNQ